MSNQYILSRGHIYFTTYFKKVIVFPLFIIAAQKNIDVDMERESESSKSPLSVTRNDLNIITTFHDGYAPGNSSDDSNERDNGTCVEASESFASRASIRRPSSAKSLSFPPYKKPSFKKKRPTEVSKGRQFYTSGTGSQRQITGFIPSSLLLERSHTRENSNSTQVSCDEGKSFHESIKESNRKVSISVSSSSEDEDLAPSNDYKAPRSKYSGISSSVVDLETGKHIQNRKEQLTHSEEKTVGSEISKTREMHTESAADSNDSLQKYSVGTGVSTQSVGVNMSTQTLCTCRCSCGAAGSALGE